MADGEVRQAFHGDSYRCYPMADGEVRQAFHGDSYRCYPIADGEVRLRNFHGDSYDYETLTIMDSSTQLGRDGVGDGGVGGLGGRETETETDS